MLINAKQMFNLRRYEAETVRKLGKELKDSANKTKEPMTTLISQGFDPHTSRLILQGHYFNGSSAFDFEKAIFYVKK